MSAFGNGVGRSDKIPMASPGLLPTMYRMMSASAMYTMSDQHDPQTQSQIQSAGESRTVEADNEASQQNAVDIPSFDVNETDAM